MTNKNIAYNDAINALLECIKNEKEYLENAEFSNTALSERITEMSQSKIRSYEKSLQYFQDSIKF